MAWQRKRLLLYHAHPRERNDIQGIPLPDLLSPNAYPPKMKRVFSMVRTLLIFCLATGMVLAQTQNSRPTFQGQVSQAAAKRSDISPDISSPDRSTKPAEPASAVASTEGVITVPGVCGQKNAGPDSCATVVTREQFENLLAGMAEAGQPVRANQREALAKAYADFLAYEEAARKAGTQETPQFREFVRYQYLRILAGVYRHALEEKYGSPSLEDIEGYYHQHLANFEEVNLRIIVVPRNNPVAKDQDGYRKKALQIATDLRERAARGEDPDDLQKEAYASLGLTIAPPTTLVGKRRRSTLAPEEADEVFALKPGEASKLESELSSYVVYRVDSKRVLPLDQVKNEISRQLSKERLESAFKAVTADVHPELNRQYFGEGEGPASDKTPGSPVASPK